MHESTLASERALMRLTLELAWLIESADDKTVDLRTAVKWLEVVSYGLDALAEDAKLRLIDVSAELAAEYRARGSTSGADFFDSSPDALGFGTSSREGDV
jgi:hypothetical protein